MSLLLLALLAMKATAFAAPKARLLKEQILEDKDAQWQITANKMSYDQEEGLFMGQGDVVLTRSGQVLYARNAIYNEKTGIVEVSGDVRIEVNGDYLTGQRAILDLNNHTGQITKAKLFLRENHYYVAGETIEKLGPDTYLVKGCRLTTCDGETPAWSIAASEVKVTVEGYGIVKDGTFRVRDIPLLYVPVGLFPAKTKRQSGLLPPGLGYSNRSGAEMELPIFWAVSDQVDATFYERYMTKRGLMQGIETRYVAEENSRGSFLFDVLSDQKEKKDMSDPDQVDISPFERTNKTRYWFRSKADQALPLGIEGRLDTDYVSDQDYLKEFQRGLFGYKGRPDLRGDFGRPVDDTLSPTRKSAWRLSRDGSAYSLQAQGAYHQRPRNPALDDAPQPLGGLLYNTMPTRIMGTPLQFRFGSNYDYIWRETGRKGHRVSFSPEVSYPLWLGPYVEFEPSVGVIRDTQWFDGEDGREDEQSRDAYEVQSRISTLLERTFDIEWGDAKRLKHKIFPTFSYRYRGYNDATRYRPWFEPIDARGKRHEAAFSLENFLDARKENEKGEVTYAQWATFSLSQAYDIHEAGRDSEPWRKKQPFKPLTGIFTYLPFPRIDIDTEVWWDHYQDDVTFADLSLEYNMERGAGRTDRYAVQHFYIKGRDSTIGGNAHVNLVEGFAVGGSLYRNLNRDHNVGHRQYLEYRSQCWGVRVSAESLEGIDTVMVSFSLLGLGELGNW
ncbi:MAG: LPS assembly protein LptD [Thermodesulfobacteriota bacterium]